MPKRKRQQEDSILDIVVTIINGLSRTALIVIGIVAVVLIAGFALVYWMLNSNTASLSAKERVELSPTQIESIKAIGQWEFLSVADEELVDTVRRGLLSDDHLVRIYYGTLRLGIDMNDVKPGWIATQGDSITVQLPAVGLLDEHFIDEARTKSFHESGRWTGADREALYHKARRQMLRHCLTPRNLRAARENGEAQFRNMMRVMGFNHVEILWE